MLSDVDCVDARSAAAAASRSHSWAILHSIPRYTGLLVRSAASRQSRVLLVHLYQGHRGRHTRPSHIHFCHFDCVASAPCSYILVSNDIGASPDVSLSRSLRFTGPTRYVALSA